MCQKSAVPATVVSSSLNEVEARAQKVRVPEVGSTQREPGLRLVDVVRDLQRHEGQTRHDGAAVEAPRDRHPARANGVHGLGGEPTAGHQHERQYDALRWGELPLSFDERRRVRRTEPSDDEEHDRKDDELKDHNDPHQHSARGIKYGSSCGYARRVGCGVRSTNSHGETILRREVGRNQATDGGRAAPSTRGKSTLFSMCTCTITSSTNARVPA